MKDQTNVLNELIKKYKKSIENLEKQINETKNKMLIASNALKLLSQEGLFEPTPDIPSIDVSAISASISDKYKNVSLNKSIIDVLNNSNKYLDGQEIYDELIKNGFQSKSSNIKRDVYVGLYRLNRDKKIISKQVEGKKKYIMKSNWY